MKVNPRDPSPPPPPPPKPPPPRQEIAPPPPRQEIASPPPQEKTQTVRAEVGNKVGVKLDVKA